ncbi:SPOSA6832_00004 [Sporobolomyces salmonicolor]|uniref:SPOSA6832_00004-mRNA-1:cds n=1 Tax=Sporidiobolus salmonicolor TaxID=5005 RepID=A0A0D6EFK3_SPOSA|nr:SPOSA6832_00004 [Sporobolomyces salmonicolor]
MTARRAARLVPGKQERWRLIVHAYPSVLAIADKMRSRSEPPKSSTSRPSQPSSAHKVCPSSRLISFPGPSPSRPHSVLTLTRTLATALSPAEPTPTSLVVLGATVPLPLLELPKHLHPDWSPLTKTQFSMVVPKVEAQLEAWKTETVVLFGIESHVCVLQTALDLLDRDINVHVLADGISSCNGDEVGIAIKRMRDAGAQITTSESALFQLIHDAAHPAFRSLAGLVAETKEPTREALEHLIAGRGF